MNPAQANNKSDPVVVPPGHQILVIHPASSTYFRQSQSGVWLAELGNKPGNADITNVITRVQKMAAQGQPAFVIWILQTPVLESSSLFDPLLTALGALITQFANTVRHCAVVPYATEHHHAQMRRLQEVRIGVHYAADDGACFVEVHRPDGIVIGMPGKAFTEK